MIQSLKCNNIEKHWQYIIENEKKLRALCFRMAYNNPDYADELWSEEVVLRIPRIFENYRSDKGSSIDNYVQRSLAWYMHKHMGRVRKRRRDVISVETARDLIGDDVPDPNFNVQYAELDDQDQVLNLLSRLEVVGCARERKAIELYYLEELTYEAVGKRLGCCKGTARNYCIAGIKKLRCLIEAGHPN